MSSTRVDTLAIFQKELKRLTRKYPSVIDTVTELVSKLEQGDRPGNSVGDSVYKVRLPNPSARRGKRSGFRIIYDTPTQHHVTLIAIYSKTEHADITDAEIRQRIASVE